MAEAEYIHGTDPDEQDRLARLNNLTNEAFLTFLDIRPGDQVLEVGCGLGLLTRRVAELAFPGEVWGIDSSAEQLLRAANLPPNLHLREGDAHALPFDDRQFDVVYCRYVLEHVTSPARVLREMQRVLRPGGKACAMENNILVNVFDPPCPHFDLLWRQFAALQSHLGGDALVGGKLFRLFREAGFAEVEVSVQPEAHCFGNPSFRVWVENLMQNVAPVADKLVAAGLVTAEQFRLGMQEVEALLQNEFASAYFYWNRARGRRPA